MKVKELFEVIDVRFNYADVTVIDDANSASVKTFSYPRNGITYIDEMLNQFGDRTIISKGVTFGTDEHGIDYIAVEVK